MDTFGWIFFGMMLGGLLLANIGLRSKWKSGRMFLALVFSMLGFAGALTAVLAKPSMPSRQGMQDIDGELRHIGKDFDMPDNWKCVVMQDGKKFQLALYKVLVDDFDEYKKLSGEDKIALLRRKLQELGILPPEEMAQNESQENHQFKEYKE